MQVIVADDEAKVRSAVRLLLEQALGLSVIEEATTVGELLNKIAQSEPDLLVLDWDLPELTGGHLGLLQSNHPQVKVVALSGRPDARRDALAAGVDAFACKVGSPDLLMLAIRTVLRPPNNESHLSKTAGYEVLREVWSHPESNVVTGTGSEL